MIRNLEMAVLVDNVAQEPLAGEWGLSILIRADEHTLLLDTGASGLFSRNAEALGVDLSKVDAGILSHAHYDHADGMETFFLLNQKAPFLVREGSRENCCGTRDGVLRYIGIQRGILSRYAARIRYVSGICEVFPGIWLVPHRKADYSPVALRNGLYTLDHGAPQPDNFAHEQSLVIETGRGLVLFNSCSHTGMTNILADIRELMGRSDICAYVGGLHLYKMTDEELEGLAAEIQRTAAAHILTGHCTGDHAFCFLKEKLGERIEQFSSGFRYRF